MEVDLETDSEPIVGRNEDLFLNKRFQGLEPHSGKQERNDSEKCESGFHSGGSLLSRDSILDEGSCISSGSERVDSGRVDSDKLLSSCEKRVGLLSLDEGIGSSLNSQELSRESVHSLPEKLPVVSECPVERDTAHCFEQDEEGDTFLHLATLQLLSQYAGNLIYLAKDPKFLNIQNNYLQTPLHLSVITDQSDLTRLLMVAGCQVDIRDHRGNTPLHIGAKYGFSKVVRHLLTPVKYEETVNSNIPYPTPYCRIPQNLEARNYEGQTPVHLAAEGGHIDSLELLINHGADINTRDGKSGRTILHYAVEMQNLSLLIFLLKQPSLNVDAFTYSHLTPLMLAKGRGHLQIVEALKERGAIYSSEESEDDEMMDDNFDDIQINGQPALV